MCRKGNNQMKSISVVLMSLVSAVVFTSLATAQKSQAAAACHCAAHEICVGGHCLPVTIVPPENASSIDIDKCSASGSKIICELPTNRITMPKKGFEKLIKSR